MTFFTKKAAVTLDDVVNFRESVDSFSETTHTVGDNLVDSLTEMAEEANQRAEELEKIAKSYDQLYSSIKQLEGDLSNRISSLKNNLQHTPKELEKQSAGKNGEVKIQRVPNPEYKELGMQIQKESSRLSELKDLSWKVYNAVSYSHRTASELASSANELKNMIPDLEYSARDVVSKTEKAQYALNKTIQTINQYLSFSFRV